MSKGEHMPSAVGYFGHTTKSDKGSKHPDVGGGPNTVEIYNKSKPTVAPAGGGGVSVPSGVVRGDGTERRKGITVKSIRSAPKGPATGGSANATPPGVVKHSGLSAPRKVR
jgi:hypothetical protein